VSEIDPKLSRLYREASSDGPPAALDAAILAAARKQIATPRRRERSSWRRWMAPASALATLVVAVSLAFLVEREQPGTIDETVIRRVPPRLQSTSPAGVTESAKTKAAGSAAAEKKESSAAADRAAPGLATRKDVPTGGAPKQSLVPAERAQVPVPATPAQAPAPRSAEPAAPAAPAAQAFPAESRAKAAAPAVVAPRAAESRMTQESNVASDSALGGAGAAATAGPAAAGKLAPMRQPAIQRTPEAWLDEISRLKREGRDKEAAEQLAEFRKVYPAYAVPENRLK
jgi:hypothetical protein